MDRRAYLISVFADTQSRIAASPALQASQQQSIAAQRLVPESAPLAQPAAAYTTEAEVIVSRRRSFEAALRYPGERVCVLNFASATHPGGGVSVGSSAQEECLCRCSTLYNCLNDKAVWEGFYTPHRLSGNALNNDDLLYTPCVQIVKDDDYGLLATPVGVDVITCAAPDLRAARPGAVSPETLLRLHEQRARRILTVAAQEQAEAVILGAFGCGAFGNDPLVVAQAYRNVLPEFVYHFRTIEFAVYCPPANDDNFRAFKQLLAEV